MYVYALISVDYIIIADINSSIWKARKGMSSVARRRPSSIVASFPYHLLDQPRQQLHVVLHILL